MSEFPGAIDYFVDESRVFTNQNDKKAIVCHGTGGDPDMTVEELGDYFRTTQDETSVHYGIGRDGRIAQYVLESDGAGGNCCTEGDYDPFWDQFPGNKNVHTLSFETINDKTNSLPLTEAQKSTVFKLVSYWVKKYKIPLSNIKGHFSLDPNNRARCPGPNFPWDEMFTYLKGGSTMSDAKIPDGWKDDGKTLIAPNGVKVSGGFRDWILTHDWGAFNWPLRPSYETAMVENSNPDLGAGAAQEFRTKRLAYTKEKGIYESWLGQELLWYMGQYNKPIPANVQGDIQVAIDAMNKVKADLA